MGHRVGRCRCHLGHVGAYRGWRRSPRPAGPHAARPRRGGSRCRPGADRRRVQPAQARKFDAEAALRQQAAAGPTTRLNEVDAALDRSFPQYASLASAAPVPLTEIGSLVGPSEALLLFVPTRDGTFLWATTAAQSRWIKVPLTSSELATRVTALRCGLDYLGEWRGEATGKCTELLQPAFEPDRETALPSTLRAHTNSMLRSSIRSRT